MEQRRKDSSTLSMVNNNYNAQTVQIWKRLSSFTTKVPTFNKFFIALLLVLLGLTIADFVLVYLYKVQRVKVNTVQSEQS